MAAGFAAPVLAAGLEAGVGFGVGLVLTLDASLTVPEGPFGWLNSPFSTPEEMALLKRVANVDALVVLLAWTYFLRAERLESHTSQQDARVFVLRE